VVQTVEPVRRSSPLIWAGVTVHALLVVVCAIGLLVSEASNGPDDLGFAAIPVALLGFPWWVPFDHALASGYLADAGIIAASLVNLGIHAGVIRWLARL
jgi:hypothetical protein